VFRHYQCALFKIDLEKSAAGMSSYLQLWQMPYQVEGSLLLPANTLSLGSLKSMAKSVKQWAPHRNRS